jgi:hypothetical protein
MALDTISENGIRWAIDQFPRLRPGTRQAQVLLCLGLQMNETGEAAVSTYMMTVLTMEPTRVVERTLLELIALRVLERKEPRGHLAVYQAQAWDFGPPPIVPLPIRSVGGAEG